MRVLLILFTVLFLTGCSEEITAEDMPAIVFVESVNYSPLYRDENTSLENDSKYRTVFIDNKGDIYTVKGYYFSEGTPEVIREIQEGEVREKIKLIGKCDVREVLQNYKKLLEITRKKDIELVKPLFFAKAFSESITVRGVYKENEEMKTVNLYKYYSSTPVESADEGVREIARWFYDMINQNKGQK